MTPQSDKKILDVLHPKRVMPMALGVAQKPTATRKSSGAKRVILIAIATLFITVAAFYSLKIWDLKQAAQIGGRKIIADAQDGAAAIQNFETGKAANAFSSVSQELTSLKQKADSLGLPTFISIGQNFIPDLKQIPGALTDLLSFSAHILSFSEKLDSLQSGAFQMAFHGQGASLIKTLGGIRDDLAQIIGLSGRLQAYANALRLPIPGDFLALTVKLYKAQSLLQSLLEYLNAPGAKHIALLFQNPSEIRPGGGFIGSYADIGIQDGSITGIDVRDIYDPDGQLSVDVLPPRPLQAITPRWGARDANWFFDFPTSAGKVISFLNQSKIYSERSVQFNATIALNVRVLEDIIAAVGPIDLPEYKLTITSDNFLENVQREVESGEDNKNGEPKKILKKLAPIILEKLAALSQSQKQLLAQSLKKRMEQKDIMAYFDDRSLEAYAQNEGWGGEIYNVNPEETDDYLAVVHANIAGGKTDAVIKEKISLESYLDMSGRVFDTLTVERSHNGGDKKDSWYKTPNKNFFQILTPAGARLLGIRGHDNKIPDPPIRRPSYLRDADVVSIENTLQWLPEYKIQTLSQFGKNTFAGYLTTHAGETKKIVAEYENDRNVILANDTNYRFVFEKQSGTEPALHYSVEAPPGFIWKETQKTNFSFDADNPEARIILDLTLQKVE